MEEEKNNIIDKVSKIIGDAFSAIGNIKNEIELLVQKKVESCMIKMDLVNRKEYVKLYDSVVKLSQEQEEIKKAFTNLQKKSRKPR